MNSAAICRRDEGDHALVHVQRLDDRRRNAAQIEQSEAERRRQERCLDVQTDHYAEPDSGDVRFRIGQQDRRNNRHHDHRDLDEIEEESRG